MQDGSKLRRGRKAAIKLSYMTNQNREREMQRQMQVLSVVESRTSTWIHEMITVFLYLDDYSESVIGEALTARFSIC